MGDRFKKVPQPDGKNFRIYDEKNQKFIHQGGKQQVRRYEGEIDEIIEELEERTDNQ